MSDRNNTIKDFSKLVLASGIALASGGSSGLIVGFINNIAGNLASSYFEKSSLKKIRELIKKPNPSELNHDLQKLVVKAVQWSIQNIEILYSEKITDDSEKEELSNFTNALLGEIGLLNETLTPDKELHKIIQYPSSNIGLLKAFDLDTSQFPIINDQIPFPQFFKTEFKPNLQLCFSELLKDENNRPALIAYQKEVFQSIETGIDTIVAQNTSVLEKLENLNLSKENQYLNEFKHHIESSDENTPHPILIKSIVDQLKPLKLQYYTLVDQNNTLLKEVQDVKILTKNIRQDLKQNWFERYKAYVIISAVILLSIIAGLVFMINNQPFNLNISSLKNPDIKIHPEYPPLGDKAKLRVYLPSGTVEKQITATNDIHLQDIPKKLRSEKIKIELIDQYWTASQDSIVLKPGSIKFWIEPNDAISRVTGRILSRDGKELLENVKISVQDLSILSQTNGIFNLELPFEYRKEVHVLRIEKEGYVTKELEYIAGSDIEIRLEKNND